MEFLDFTVLLSVPRDIADDSTPWRGTYLWTGLAPDVHAAIGQAQAAAADAHEYEEEEDSYAVLLVCHGQHSDITPEAHQ